MAVEERVRVAIDNWAPRFIANGIDANDFQNVTSRVERWDDWCKEWSACGAMHAQLGEQAEAAHCYTSMAQHYFQAAISYHFGKYVFVHRPDELRVAHTHVVTLYQKALPYFDIPGERLEIPYEPGTVIPGIFRKPPHVAKPPLVILVPGLDSVKEELHIYSNDFLRRGMATLAIDGPGQGEMEFAYPLRYDYEVPIRSVLDYLRQRDDLDTERIGLLGVSLGGHFAPRVLALEPRIRAAISISGAYHLREHFARYPILTQETFIHRLKAANRADALEKLAKFDLTDVLPHIRHPLLIIAGRRDRIFPPQEAENMQKDAGEQAELWMFDDGNHVCNNIPYKYRLQQADWMRQKLLA